jgi:hypothetical protein
VREHAGVVPGVARARQDRYHCWTMANWDRSSGATMAFPKPGRALMGVMLALLAIWVMFAMALQWGDADPRLFELLMGNSAAIRELEIWRLFTAPLIHAPSEP